MTSMRKIGITGGIGSGKTVVSSIFQRIGIPVFNADKEAKAVVAENDEAEAQIKREFGEDLYDNDGELNRKKLASIVFNDDKALKKLNTIVHPLVKKRFEQWVNEQENVPYVIKEAAILFEAGSDNGLDTVIAVYAPEELRVKRVMERDNVSEKEVKDRMKNQMDEEKKRDMAGHVILNNEKDALIPQVLKLHNSFTA